MFLEISEKEPGLIGYYCEFQTGIMMGISHLDVDVDYDLEVINDTTKK